VAGKVRTELSEQERRFVEEYLIDLDVVRAALAAGYTKSIALSKAFMWLCPTSKGFKPLVYAAVQEGIKARSERTHVTQDMVVRELALLGFSNMRDFTAFGPDGVTLKDMGDMADEATRCIAEVSQSTTENGGSIKFKLHDKQAALVTLARHLGMLTDKTEHSGAVTVIVKKPE